MLQIKSKAYKKHGFSSKANLSYIGPYPPAYCYGVERMTTGEKSDFFTWYETVRQGIFDFREQAKKKGNPQTTCGGTVNPLWR